MSCNICSMCGGTATSPNYAKQVDPPTQQYGTILGDAPQKDRRMPGRHMPPVQVCLPTFAGTPPPNPGRHNPGQQPCIVNVPCDPVKACPQIVCEPCPPPPPTKVWLIKSSPVPQKVGLNSLLMFLLSFAIAQPPPCVPICNKPIFIPCQPHC